MEQMNYFEGMEEFEDLETVDHVDVLVVVDMQNDFIDGALGTKEAQAIVANVSKRIEKFNGLVLYTKDTHDTDYLQTQEGKKLPVEHCIVDTKGWELHPEIEKWIERDDVVFEKPTFGSVELAEELGLMAENLNIDSVTLVGLCTDICVISNAMMLRAFLPETPIRVDAACCAGVTPESHARALESMKSCQIEIV